MHECLLVYPNYTNRYSHTFHKYNCSENIAKILKKLHIWKGLYSYVRSSHPEVFCKEGVHRNFAKFTGKHLYQSLFFDKVAGFRLQASTPLVATSVRSMLERSAVIVITSSQRHIQDLVRHLWRSFLVKILNAW